MRKIFAIIFIILVIPFTVVLVALNRFAKDKNYFTNKIENKKEWSETNLTQANKRILKNQTVTQEFKSDYNNLGTIAIQFTNFQKINNDSIYFNVIEKSSNKTIYKNTYKVDQFNPDFPFTFGFPPITDSRNKTYIFQIKSVNGTKNNSIGIANIKYFTIKYDFSIATIMNNPTNFFELININLSSLNQVNKRPLGWMMLGYILTTLLVIFNNNKKFVPQNIANLIPKTFPVILFILTTVISSYFSTIGTDPHHDGIMLKPAIDVAQGKMLFKETFTQYGALSVIFQTIAIKIFGEYLITIKILTGVFYGLISVSIYYIWSHFLSKQMAFFSGIIWILLAPYYMLTFLAWSSVYALLFQCVTILFIQKYFQNNSSKSILFAGMMSAMTFWCKQNVGLYTIIGSIVSILLIRIIQKQKNQTLFKNVVQYAGGGLIASIPIIIWIVANGALIDWWKQTIAYSSFWIKTNKTNQIFENFFPHAIGPISIWAISPIITMIIIFKQLLINKKKNILLLIVCIFGIFSWPQYYPITCLRHVYWAATPMIGIVIYFFYKQIFDNNSNKHVFLKTIIFLIVCSIVFGPDITTRIQVGRQKIATKYVNLDNPTILKNIKLSPEEADFYSNIYQEINKYINQKPDSNLITIGANALYLTFSKSVNFHPMYLNWASINQSIYPDYPGIKNQYIDVHKPLIISMWEQVPAGYCKVNDLVNPIDSAFLIAPCK